MSDQNEHDPNSSIPFVDLAPLHERYSDQFHEIFDRAVQANVFVGGPSVDAFEAALAWYTGSTYAIGVNSGTAALQIGLLSAGIGPGDEVVIPATTFFATLEAVVHTGATPIVVDVDASACIDTEAVRAALTPRTAAVVAVHLYGQPADIPALRTLCSQAGLLLVEDAAQAMGAGIREGAALVRRVGSLGDVAAFSFYPTKNLGALGDGGAITTDDPRIAEKARILRSHGARSKHDHVLYGYSERLHALQASFLELKLADLDTVQAERDALARVYSDGLAAIDLERPNVRPHSKHVWHLQTVWVSERDRVAGRLRAARVASAVHYPVPMHKTHAYLATQQTRVLPMAERIADETLSLPFYPFMGERRVHRVLEELANALAPL